MRSHDAYNCSYLLTPKFKCVIPGKNIESSSTATPSASTEISLQQQVDETNSTRPPLGSLPFESGSFLTYNETATVSAAEQIPDPLATGIIEQPVVYADGTDDDTEETSNASATDVATSATVAVVPVISVVAISTLKRTSECGNLSQDASISQALSEAIIDAMNVHNQREAATADLSQTSSAAASEVVIVHSQTAEASVLQ